ncbi:MAG: TIGR03435 family protein [Edaphobacter sp.]
MALSKLLLLLFLTPQLVSAQTSAPAFEVATIKPAAPSPDGHTHINYPPGDNFSAINITLLNPMRWAYKIPEKQILNGPSWLSSTRFDIQAKADSTEQIKPLRFDQDLKRRMVQALFADRFYLKLHQETRALPAYDLVIAKNGSKLQLAKSDGKTIRVGRSYFTGQGLTTAIIAEQLSDISGRIVIDKTNLKGSYDLKLQWTPDDAPATNNSAPSFFTALQEQLGLKLESAKEAVPVLVIDHIELPTPN